MNLKNKVTLLKVKTKLIFMKHHRRNYEQKIFR
nr:MAG TPA: hypothetical protein [Caudoviricetes sp.]